MGETPDQIRQEIKETRDDLSGTIEQLSSRADLARRFRLAGRKTGQYWRGTQADGNSGASRARPALILLAGVLIGIWLQRKKHRRASKKS